MSVRLARRLFTVDDFYLMAQAGILNEDDHVELIEGEIIEMTPIGSSHASVVVKLTRLLSRSVEERATVSIQNPLRLDERSEPMPDVMLLRPRADDYSTSHPRPADALLLIEVADTSIEYDREVKLGLYAQAAVSEVWIVDLESQTVEVYRDPFAAGYLSATIAGRGDSVSPAAFPEVQLRVSDILG